MEGGGSGPGREGEEEEEEEGDQSIGENNYESMMSGSDNDLNQVMEETEQNMEDSTNEPSKINAFNFLLTNARSLAPKLDSFVENFQERDIDLAVVTETWLYEGCDLLADGSVDLRLGEGIGALHCGRSGRRGGGVGVFYRTSRLKVHDITPKDNPHEICASLCSLRGSARKIVCIGVYLITALDEAAAELLLEYVNDLIHLYKSRYQDPFFIVAGDWNKADTDIAFSDSLELQRCKHPLRGGTKCWTLYSQICIFLSLRQRLHPL